MNPIKLLAGAALFSALVSTAAFAADTAATCPAKSNALPRVEKAVAPEGLPRRFVGATVKVTFTVDENGQPQDIAFVKPESRDLQRSLLPALAQWRFTPATENGVPVAKRVVLPVTFSVDS